MQKRLSRASVLHRWGVPVPRVIVVCIRCVAAVPMVTGTIWNYHTTGSCKHQTHCTQNLQSAIRKAHGVVPSGLISARYINETAPCSLTGFSLLYLTDDSHQNSVLDLVKLSRTLGLKKTPQHAHPPCTTFGQLCDARDLRSDRARHNNLV